MPDQVYVLVEEIYRNVDLDWAFFPEIRGVFASYEAAEDALYANAVKFNDLGGEVYFYSADGYLEIHPYDLRA